MHEPWHSPFKQKWLGGLPVMMRVERTTKISAKLDSERVTTLWSKWGKL